MQKLALYTTLGCHLCDDARTLLFAFLGAVPLEEIEISGNDVLLERYGERIPVVARRDTGAELDWPFSAADLRAFLR